MVDFLKTTLVCLIVALLGAPVCYAQIDDSLPATPENIALGFYRTAGIVPNLDSWIKKGDLYRNTIPGRRPKIYEGEMQRLQEAYQAFDPSKTVIRIRTSVVLSLHEQNPTPEETVYQLEIQPNSNENMLYFPYEFGAENIAVIPAISRDFLKPMLDDNQYKYVLSLFENDARYYLIMKLRAVDANISRPYEIDGVQRWVFKTSVLSAEVWSSKGKLLWEYTMPGYLAPHHEAVHKLRQQRLDEQKEKNSFFESGLE